MTGMSQPAGTWSEIDLSGHASWVFEPAVPSDHPYVVIYLHGGDVGRLADLAEFTHEFDRHGLRVIQPMTGRSWWTDRIWPGFDVTISAEGYVLERVVPHVAERWSARPPRLALLGMSMGGQAALRIAYKRPSVFPTVAALSPAIDFHRRIGRGIDPILDQLYRDEEDARQDTALLHADPRNWPRNQFFSCDPTDPWFESADRLRMKLRSLGIPFQCDLETEAGGHSLDYARRMAEPAVRFLAEGLEAERLRLV
jgi:pimeloyl-ACP methyl ester carboxylesterase